jgi:DNA-binding transcriptional ArsR family regulator
MTDDRFDPPLARAFPHSTRLRLAGALTDAPDGGLGATELTDHADVGRATFYDHGEELVDIGVMETVESDATTRYRLADTEVARTVRRLNDAVGDRLAADDREFADALTDFRT